MTTTLIDTRDKVNMAIAKLTERIVRLEAIIAQYRAEHCEDMRSGQECGCAICKRYKEIKK